MNISIINISDFPAIISDYEELNWINYLKVQWFMVNDYDLSTEMQNIEKLNSLLLNDNTEIVLFSSWWFNAINNINKIVSDAWKNNKVLIWFSDTLHIQWKFHDYENIYCIYWFTLRNIFELTDIETNMLLNFIKNKDYNTLLKVHKSWNNIISWKIYWWHLMIFINLLSIYKIDNLEWCILFLEFHWMEDYFIYYYLDFLKINNIFSKISWIILDVEDIKLIEYFKNNNVLNIYSLWKIRYLPIFKEVIINKWNLMMQK